MKTWSAKDALKLYNIPGWGRGFFGVNGKGHLVAYPKKNKDARIDLIELIRDAQGQGLSLPLLIRFSDILNFRLSALRRAFQVAVRRAGYGGRYLCVYPVKVNQQRQVVEEIVRFGGKEPIGLEAGSKTELHAVLAMMEQPGSVIICNGFKDEAYVRLALMGQKLGHTVFLVAEKPAELPLILRLAREAGVTPSIGVRIKLVAQGSGKWEDSGGDRSKFGLTAAGLLAGVELLRRDGCLENLRLIHFHLGSQVSDIRSFQEAMREMGRYYVELRKLGCRIELVDVGGGLGVDYDGSGTEQGFSVNYDEEAYAAAVVDALAAVCAQEGLPHPGIITEAGRALTAHHAMLALNVLEISSLQNGGTLRLPPGEEEAALVRDLARLQDRLNGRNCEEIWRKALGTREEANRAFEQGVFSLSQRARFDDVFWKLAGRVERLMRRGTRVSEEQGRLETLLADRYYCNFSVFQSLPDSWAIGQEFPIVPLQRLLEKPTRRAILEDITCDSDGRIDRFISPAEHRATLPLHPIRNGEPYFLGVFLTGAYQEILGDLHNLFGDTNAVHVALNEDGSWRYEQVIRGETVARVLGYVQFSREALIEGMERQVNRSIGEGRMTRAEAGQFMNSYLQGLDGLTYLLSGEGSREQRRSSHRTVAG